MSDYSEVKWKTATNRLLVFLCAGCLWSDSVSGTAVAQNPDASQAAGGEGELPDPVAILRSVREMQASIRQTLQGKLRRGGRTLGYRMVMDGNQVRFEFPDAAPPNPKMVVLKLGEKESKLEIQGGPGAERKVDFADEIGGMGVNYEDLALRFLYWNEAVLEGEERLMLSKCWRIRVRRPAGVRSQYAQVVVWVSQSNGAFLKSEAYHEDGTLLKRLTVRSVQAIGQATTLKQLRIETAGRGDEPAYLDVDGQAPARISK